MAHPYRFIDQFEVILLDLMDTLMFGGNRFSDQQDYARTYRQLGGSHHPDGEVQRIIRQVYATMKQHYADPAYRENFRPASHYVHDVLAALRLPTTDARRLHDVFAHHELGTMPAPHCQALRQLASTHRLGLVSDLWSEKPLVETAFRRSAVHHLFETLIFSSDYSLVKPSPRLFQKALDALGCRPEKVLFVGNSPERDIAGAEAIGLTAVLVGNEPDPRRPVGLSVGYVGDLLTR